MICLIKSIQYVRIGKRLLSKTQWAFFLFYQHFNDMKEVLFMKESLLIHSPGEDNSIRDESLFTGRALSVSSPQTADEVKQIFRYCAYNGMTITAHG